MTAWSCRRAAAAALLALLAVSVDAQSSLNNLPNLSTATASSGTSGSSASDATSTGASTSDGTSTAAATSSTASQSGSSSSSSGGSTTGTESITNAPSLSTGSSATSVFSLTSAPTIAGAGIPTMVVPNTAGAPFMQKSTLPEGTVFIVVGAVLAFLGACVLLWRGLVAWSINRSVKKAALASIRGGSEKAGTRTWRGTSYQPLTNTKGGSTIYKNEYSSSMSLDALTSSGKPFKPHFRDSVAERASTPPQGLFFSPTAQARDSAVMTSQRSSFMPSGYYAMPSAQAANGAGNTTLGAGHIAPYARGSHASLNPQPSPPSTPGGTAAYRGGAVSRDGLRAPSRNEGGPRLSSAMSGENLSSARNSAFDPSGPRQGGSRIFGQPSSSSLMVGANSEASDRLSRAPSAYLDDLFENHGNGPRERF